MTTLPSPDLKWVMDLVDETGMSGTGKVAEGVILPTGVTVMWWIVPPYSVGVYPSAEALVELHGHGKDTSVLEFEV